MYKDEISQYETSLGYLLLCCSYFLRALCSGTNCTVAEELLRVNNKFQEMFFSVVNILF